MADPFNLTRRSLIERTLLLVGAGATGGFSLSALAQTAASGPYLNAPAFTLLTAVADTIVPRTDSVGALDANVPANFDALLHNWASAERRMEITKSLLQIDKLARQTHGKAFTKLDPQARHDLLAAHDEKALQILPSAKPASGLAALMKGPNYANPGYGKMKEVIVALYYMSEPALTRELTYEHAPGEWQPSIPVTPQTRPAGGTLF
jgi:gluconate 2-dehydrogenase gamma chain